MTVPDVHNVTSPAVVVDKASLIYHVRSSDGNSSKIAGLLSGLGLTRGVSTRAIPALEPLSFVAQQGEAIGIIGSNGSGKSTLMKLITGQLLPTTGAVYATSIPIMLGVNAALVPTVSGADNITLGCLAMGMTPEQVDAKYSSIVDLSGLEDALHLPLKAYSSGMAARLQFAIATSVDPEILVIDEALNTGDAHFRARTGKRIDELRQNAGCVFLVSHSLGTIREMCTRAIWIEQGVLLMDSTPDEVTQEYGIYMRYLSRNRVKGARLFREEKLRTLQRTEVEWVNHKGPKKGLSQ
ncbi:ABC transporter ATP-binding protein [Auritidibacter ignavus]|uniref:ABC transporter ATP-binding protein n=1 Tax=Auritidibacter ignavus TaxID=678932 RepID=UPI00109C1B2D|nr:ATP-binding cassette domain-containing protein [Auritidibacter ignavus]